MTDLLSLDLKSFAEEGVSVQLTHPITSEKLDSYITVKGADSSAYKNALIAVSKSKTAGADGDFESDGAEIMAAITINWKGLSLGKEELVFSREEAFKIYKQYSWISDQVFSAINDRTLFLANAEAS